MGEEFHFEKILEKGEDVISAIYADMSSHAIQFNMVSSVYINSVDDEDGINPRYRKVSYEVELKEVARDQKCIN